MQDKRLLSDPEAIDIIKNVCQVKNTLDLQKLDRAMRNEYLKQFKGEYHLSIRQIERLALSWNCGGTCQGCLIVMHITNKVR